MGRSLRDLLPQCKSHAQMIYGHCVEVSGEQWQLPAYFTTITALCESKQNSGDVSWRTTALAAGHWLGCWCWSSLLASCPSCCGPWLVPNRYPGSFPMRVNTHRYTLFPLSVYSHMLIPINLLLVSIGVEGGSWRVCVGLGGRWRWVKHSHTTWKPCLTDCTRSGFLFTLSRCGLPLVFLSNYPSLSESMCQSHSFEMESRVWARAEREGGKQRDL